MCLAWAGKPFAGPQLSHHSISNQEDSPHLELLNILISNRHRIDYDYYWVAWLQAKPFDRLGRQS